MKQPIVSMENVSMILRTDSYKVSHWKQLPPKTTNLYSYFESRGGEFPEIVFFGMNYYLKRYLSVPVTMADVDYAEKRFALHFGNNELFNRKGWERIVNVHGGYMPVRIKSCPEGLVVPTRNVLVTVENTDDELPWVVNYIETLISKLWYTCTVATRSRNIRKLILQYLTETGDPSGIDFKLHDFGARGTEVEESAAVGGMAHLINFMGTDTLVATEAAYRYYGEEMAGYSIPAAEHSTITSWGEAHEYEAYENMIKQFGSGLYAVVSDSYNIYTACRDIWGTQLKAQVLAATGTLVIRPDSGVPNEVVRQVVEILGEKFGYETNLKGFKVLNKVRVIQGDGVNHAEIGRILEALKIRGWSAENVAFGMGGELLQNMNRDTSKYAFKASSAIVAGSMRDVFKAPVTDSAKWSKRGRLKLIYGEDGVLTTVDHHAMGKDVLQTVWENGELLIDPPFSEIRERAKATELAVW